jgi:hypothetical protein
MIPSDRMTVKMTSGGDLQFNMGSELRWGPGIFHITKSEVREGFWHEEKFSLDPAGIEFMTLSPGGPCLMPRPPDALCNLMSLLNKSTIK